MSDVINLNNCRLPGCTYTRDINIGGAFCKSCMTNSLRRFIIAETGVYITQRAVESVLYQNNTVIVGEHLRDRITHWHKFIKTNANDLIKKEEANRKLRGIPDNEYI